MFSRKTVIVDLGASRTALGRFSRSQGRLRLDELVVEAFPGPAGGEAGWLEQTRTALSVLRTKTSIRGSVVLVLPPHLTLTKLIKTPRVEPAQRRKILRFEAEQCIPYAPNDVVWDTVVASEHESELEMLLVAVKRDAMEELCAVVRAAGFVPELALPSSLATLAAFRQVQPGSTEPLLVLNLGYRSSTLLQVTGKRFLARSLALGTRNIAGETAEPPDHVALEIIVTRLAQEIARSVLYFRRQSGCATPGRVCLTGGGARLAGLEEALAARLKVPVERLDLSAAVETGSAMAPNDGIGRALTFADLAGAAATQLGPGQPVLNLLPPSLRQKANQRRRLWLAAAILVTTAASWPLISHRPPAVAPAPAVAVIRSGAERRLAEVPGPSSAANQPGEAEPLGLELLAVQTAPFPLQLAGYFGEPGDYLVAFVSADQPGILLARRGHRFAQLGLTLRSFEVRKVAVDHADPWPVYEAAGFALLHDEKTGAEVALDSRRKPEGTLQAVLRGTADREPSTRREGELIEQRGTTYRIQRIQAAPPEVVVVRQTGGSGLPETQVLQPAHPEAPSVPDSR